jgi:hypothetical protein
MNDYVRIGNCFSFGGGGDGNDGGRTSNTATRQKDSPPHTVIMNEHLGSKRAPLSLLRIPLASRHNGTGKKPPTLSFLLVLLLTHNVKQSRSFSPIVKRVVDGDNRKRLKSEQPSSSSSCFMTLLTSRYWKCMSQE